MSYFVTRPRLRMAVDFSWAGTSQVGATDTGSALDVSRQYNRQGCLQLCAAFS